MWLLLGLASGAEVDVDVDALIVAMGRAVAEVEQLHRGAGETLEIARCIDERLVSMQALMVLARHAQAASSTASREGKAGLEARKVMVAARRQEALRVQAHQCRPETVTVLDCTECPTEEGLTEAPAEEEAVGPIGVAGRADTDRSSSPFE